MKKFIAHRYTIRQNLFNILGICLCVYFTYHAAFGQRSYFRLAKLEKENSRYARIYEELHADRKELEERVVRLRPTSLDIDLLEERARYVLGYSRPDEKMVLSGHIGS